MTRSAKQHKSSLNRIKLENKSTKQASKLIAKQYQMLGRKIPQKILNETATIKDMNKYMNTLNNALDRRIFKEELKGGSIERKLNELNRINQQRKKETEKLLIGYDKGLVSAYTQGKLISIGRDVTVSMVSTNEIDKDRIVKLAKLNKAKSVDNFLNERIKNAKEDLNNIKKAGNDDYSYIKENMITILESYGYTFTEQNLNEINRSMKNLDFMSAQKLDKIISVKLENRMYEIYKEEFNMMNNSNLMDDFRNDIRKSSRIKINENYRVIT